jgi:GNAT superfamily N-acetyltransferase
MRPAGLGGGNEITLAGLFIAYVDHLEHHFAENAGPVGQRGNMRMKVHLVTELTADEQSALRTLSLAVYPPEIASLWPGRAIEWVAAQWSIIGWNENGEALCHLGVLVRDARWNERPVKIGGIGGVKTHPACRGQGFATAAMERALHFSESKGMSISPCWSVSRALCRSTSVCAGAGSMATFS